MKPIKKNIDNYKPKKDRSLRFLTFAVFSLFIGFGFCIGFYPYTLIDLYGFSKILAVFTVFGFLIPLKYYQKWFHFIKYETIIFNFIGTGPLLTGLFFLLNFTFSSNPFVHQYKIEKMYFEGDESYKSFGVILENNIFSGERKIVELSDISPYELMNKKYLKLTISKGLFGYDVIKERELIQ